MLRRLMLWMLLMVALTLMEHLLLLMRLVTFLLLGL